MKIVAVGDPSAPPAAERDESSNAEDAESDSTSAEAGTSKAKTPEDFEELPEEELALVSEPQSTREPEPDSVEVPLEGLEPEQPISIPPTEILTESAEAAPAAAPPARDGEQQPKPPPPPTRNKPKTPSLPKPVPRAKRRAKPPWWEDVFGEDFVRATFRVGDHQIRKEVDFIEESLGVASGGVVLDLGCGAGHHAVELASRGYGVVGYDLSLYQLTLAADVAQERGQKLNFLQGDMREMAFEEMFDGIFCWNTTFGYFEEEKNQYVAERVFQALRPGGMFLLDVVNRDYVAASSPCQLWYEGDACVCMDDMDLDFITSRMNVKRSVILDDGRTREVTYSVRVYSLHELGKMLHDVGFRVTEASGHPSTPGVFFGEHSPRIIILAQKP